MEPKPTRSCWLIQLSTLFQQWGQLVQQAFLRHNGDEKAPVRLSATEKVTQERRCPVLQFSRYEVRDRRKKKHGRKR